MPFEIPPRILELNPRCVPIKPGRKQPAIVDWPNTQVRAQDLDQSAKEFDKYGIVIDDDMVVVDVDVGLACLLEHLMDTHLVAFRVVGQQKTQVVLVPVHGEHTQRCRIGGPLDPGDVVGEFGHSDRATLVLRKVVDVHAHVAVVLPGLGILEGVGVGVE